MRASARRQMMLLCSYTGTLNAILNRVNTLCTWFATRVGAWAHGTFHGTFAEVHRHSQSLIVLGIHRTIGRRWQLNERQAIKKESVTTL